MTDALVGLGPRIRHAREGLGLTPQQLADLSGVPRPTIQRIETGQRTDIGLHTLRALALALRVSLDYLGEMDRFRTDVSEDTPSEMVLAVQSGLDALPALRG